MSLKTSSKEQDLKKIDISAKHERPPRSRLAAITLVLGCTLGNISTIAGAAIQIILYRIGEDLHIPQAQLQWPITAYSLTGGCFLLLMGRLADIYGRKKGYLLGTVWFIIWALASGFAQNEIQIAIFRAFQGMGTAAVIPSAIGILAQEFPPGRARSIAFATFSCGAPMGGSIGSLVGGTLTQLSPASWRAMFWVLCGMTSLSALAIFFVVPPDVRDPDADRRVDWIGAAIVTTSLVFLLFVLAQGEVAPNGWKTGYIIALLILSVIGLACFVIWEHHLETRTTFPPLMKLSLWTRANGKFAVIMLVGFFAWISFTSWSFWANLFYQSYLRLSVIKTMIRFIPMFVSGIACNFVVALVVTRISGAILLGIGCAATGAACVLFATIKPSAAYWAFGFPAATLVVFGADFIFATGSIFVAKIALPHEQSLAGGVFNTLMQVGGSVGLAITAVVADQVTKREAARLGVNFDPRNPDTAAAPSEALLKGYRAAQWAGFAFVMISLALVVVFLRGIGRVGHSGRAKMSPVEDEIGEEISQATVAVSGPSTPVGVVKAVQVAE